MSEFLQLGSHISIQKGKPPLSIPFQGKESEIYLNPEYLRNRAVGVPSKAGSDAIRVVDGETVLLWDGSNAGEFFKAKRGLVASTMARISPNEKFCPAFFFHLMKHAEPILKNQTNGTGIPHVDKEILEAISVFCPNVTEQGKIANVLDTLDTAIHKTEAIVEKLKQVKQGLLHDLLTRGVDANGELRPSYEQAPELYQESPLGWIPKDWMVCSLENLAEVSRGKFTHRPRNDPRFYGGKYPFIQTGDVAAGEGELVSKYSQTLSERGTSVSQEFPAGTIAITIAANIADTAILAIPMYFPDSVVGAVVRPQHNVRFIELYIRKVKPILNARAPQSAQKNINLQDLRPLLLAVPQRSEQDAIAERYEALQCQLQNEEHALAKFRLEKAGLMDDLLTGHVRVTPLLSVGQPA